MRVMVSLRRRRTLRASNVPQRKYRPDVGAQPRRDIAPRPHVLRLFLRPHHLFDIGIRVDETADALRPGIQFLDSNDGYPGRSLLLDQVVEDLAGAENDS